MSERVWVGGQPAWRHRGGMDVGSFVTFDALTLPGDAPHKVHVWDPGAVRGVLVAFDGDTAFWRGGVAHATWDMAHVAARTPGVAVVAIVPNERDREYTHVDWALGTRPFGDLATHAAWVADAVLPFVQRAWGWPTSPESSAIVGSSHGGLAAFWAATRHPDRFGLAACLSPSLFSGLGHGDRLQDAPILAPVADLLRSGRGPRLWVDWGGRRDGGPHNHLVERLAAARGEELVHLLSTWGFTASRVGPNSPLDDADVWWASVAHHGHDEAAWHERLGWVIPRFFR